MSRWTRGEMAVIAGATGRAPSVHNTQPWAVQFDEGSVSLYERPEVRLPRHDPAGRDRLISCGAALTDLQLALRVLGWSERARTFPDRGQPDLVATVHVEGRQAPSAEDLALYRAIARRRTHRSPFAGTPVTDELRTALMAVSGTDRVALRPIRMGRELLSLAELLGHAGLQLRGDREYQRELTMWTNQRPDHPAAGGIPASMSTWDTLPWVGLVRATTTLPQADILATRLHRECLFVVETPDDGPLDHLQAGRALQRSWLWAVHIGLVGSVLTQPLQLPEVRAGLVEKLDLAGFPQAVLRFGHPVDVSPPSPRLPVNQIIRSEFLGSAP